MHINIFAHIASELFKKVTSVPRQVGEAQTQILALERREGELLQARRYK